MPFTGMNGHLNKILTIESRESGFAERDRNQAFVLRYYLSFVAKINRFEASTKAKSVCVHLRPRSFCVLKRTYIIPHVLFKTFQYLQILIRINRTVWYSRPGIFIRILIIFVIFCFFYL